MLDTDVLSILRVMARKKIQWHPLFTRLLRPQVERYYEIRTEVPVGDLPRRADMVLLRRVSAGPLPFRGLWRYLTPWNVLDFKGRTEAARPMHLPLLVELGLGIGRRLQEEGPAGEVETMAQRSRRTLTIDISPVVETLGLAEVIRQIGEENVIRQIGEENVIRQIGKEKVLREIGPKEVMEQLDVQTIWDNLPAGKRRQLERLVAERSAGRG